MDYQEARVYLDNIAKFGSVLGLDNIKELLRRLGNPQDSLRFIHIAGTNGKGSALAYLSTVLTRAGYRTGRYISPHLIDYRERYQIDGKMIEPEDLARLATHVRDTARQMEEGNVGSPTCFEIETAIVMLYFKENNCDVAVLETGLGGRLDATNVVTTTVLEVIASISRDHIDLLGNTLAEIAGEKAGIIKPNTIVCSAKQEKEAEDVLIKVCRDRGCDLRIVDNERISDIRYGCAKQSFTYKNWKNVEISLAGGYQMKNASLALEAIAALRELGFRISDEQAYAGMKKTCWWGRFTQVASEPAVIIDGAHNEAAARELKTSLELYFKGRKLYYLMGVLKDKEYDKVIGLTAPLAEHIVTIETPNNVRALSAQELRDAVAKVNPSVEAAGSIAEGVKQLYRMAGKDDVIVIFGSLSFLGDAEKYVLEEVQNG